MNGKLTIVLGLAEFAACTINRASCTLWPALKDCCGFAEYVVIGSLV